jgi:hypothetical protein
MDEETGQTAAPVTTPSLPPSLSAVTTAGPPPPPRQQTETTTNMYPLDNEVRIDSEEIVDVIRNFIAEKDPMLELFLTVCFVHPHCFKAGPSGLACLGLIFHFEYGFFQLQQITSGTF